MKLIKSPDDYFLLLWNNVHEFFGTNYCIPKRWPMDPLRLRFAPLAKTSSYATACDISKSRLFFAFAIRWSGEVRSTYGLTVTKSNCNLGRNSDINWIPITGKQTKSSGKLYGVFAAKDLLMLDPPKTKMLSYSAMRRTSLVDGEYFRGLSNPVTITPRGTFREGKYHHSSWSLLCCQNTEGCRLW